MPDVEHAALSRRRRFAGAFPGVLGPRRLDQSGTLDEGVHLERRSLGVVVVLFASTDNQGGTLIWSNSQSNTPGMGSFALGINASNHRSIARSNPTVPIDSSRSLLRGLAPMRAAQLSP